MLDGVLVTPLRRIPTAAGEVRHAMKATDPGYSGFGEVYFSAVDSKAVKGWKRHLRMVLNLVVVSGSIRFCIWNDDGVGQTVDLALDSEGGYARLTVPPGLWVAFGGVGADLNLLLNVASLPHDPTESETRALSAFEWSWRESLG